MWQYIFTVCILFHDMPHPQCMQAVGKLEHPTEEACAVRSHIDQTKVRMTIEEYATTHGKELLGFKVTHDICVKG